MPRHPVIIVHGGADEWPTGAEPGRVACRAAALAGMSILEAGGTALDAATAAVCVVEDDPACNAGTGAVLTNEGTLELDACVMDGSSLRSGAVASLPPFKHPVDIARAVLDDGRYHLLVGDGAARFAAAEGFAACDPDLMITDERRAEFDSGVSFQRGNTVGAVVLDGAGRLAAATSTGGIPGMDAGRVGDVPIVGAGTFADDRAACSCTGEGEAFARACAAFWTTQRARLGAQKAADDSVARVRDRFGGVGGVIVLTCDGTAGIANTATAMPYAVVRLGHTPLVGH